MTHKIIILSYPKYTCNLIANYISSCILEDGATKIFDLSDDITLPIESNPKAVFIIFPILSDNRLPKEVEKFINNLEQHQQNFSDCFLIVTGDFDAEAAHAAVVVSEAIRLLNLKGINLAYTPLMIDTPCKELKVSHKIWVEKALEVAFDQDNFLYLNQGGYNSLPKIIKSHTIFTTKEWEKICNILPHPPFVSYTSPVEELGLKLSLLTLGDYPRSLLVDLPRSALRELFMLIDNLPNIASLSIAFAELDEWPYKTDNLFNNLRKLDIRANNFSSHNFLEKFSQLQKLNIACNSLEAIPEEILNHKRIRILLAYKNKISSLSDKINHMTSLQKLNLYRNSLTTIPEEIEGCFNLNDINLGANPIQSLPKSLKELKFLKKLSLRNCYLKELPPIISQLKLEYFDTSKNPYLSTI